MSIKYFSVDVPLPKLRKKITSDWIKNSILAEEKRVGDISFVFCSDDYLLEVNQKYLNHDYFTDVITFDYVEGDLISGDIFISLDRISENASVFKVPFIAELNRVLIHGVLHLLGYKDKDKRDKLVMTDKEDFFLNLLNIN